MSASVFRNWVATTLRQAFWAPGLVLVIWAVAAKGFNAYIRYPNLDIATHLFGGLAGAYFFDVGVLNLRHLSGPIHLYFRLALSIGFVAVIAIFWEFGEYLSDLCLGSHLNLGVSDTLSDLLFGLLGAGCFVVLRLVQRRIGGSACT